MRSRELTEELHALRRVMSGTPPAASETATASNTGADEIVDDIETAVTDVQHFLRGADLPLQTIITQRPLATVASVFALGLVVGIMLRRR